MCVCLIRPKDREDDEDYDGSMGTKAVDYKAARTNRYYSRLSHYNIITAVPFVPSLIFYLYYVPRYIMRVCIFRDFFFFVDSEKFFSFSTGSSVHRRTIPVIIIIISNARNKRAKI